MSDYRFGDDYKLNIFPKEAIDCWGEIDIDKVEAVEIEWVDFFRKTDDKSRWHELFGTPERAAQLIADNCEFLGYCGQCWIRAANCDGKYLTVLEWLRGDAE